MSTRSLRGSNFNVRPTGGMYSKETAGGLAKKKLLTRLRASKMFTALGTVPTHLAEFGVENIFNVLSFFFFFRRCVGFSFGGPGAPYSWGENGRRRWRPAVSPRLLVLFVVLVAFCVAVMGASWLDGNLCCGFGHPGKLSCFLFVAGNIPAPRCNFCVARGRAPFCEFDFDYFCSEAVQLS